MWIRRFWSILFLIFFECEIALGLIQLLFRGTPPNNSSSKQLPSKRQASGGLTTAAVTEAPLAFQPALLMEFGDECEVNGHFCNSQKFLDCIDGKCMCKNPMTHAYDEDLLQCVALAGSNCGAARPACVKNSQCKFGSCQCDEGHSETSSKVCMKRHRQSCVPGTCNGDQGLACMKGLCQCMDDTLVFEPFTSKCRNPQEEFDRFARNVGRDVAQRVVSRTITDATSLAFFPFRFLIPGIGR